MIPCCFQPVRANLQSNSFFAGKVEESRSQPDSCALEWSSVSYVNLGVSRFQFWQVLPIQSR